MEAFYQLFHRQPGFFAAGGFKDNFSPVHHNKPAAVGQRHAHVVGYHHNGKVVVAVEAVGEFQDPGRVPGVQSGGVFIQKNQFGGGEHHHKHGKRLALAAGEPSGILFHPIFKSHVQSGQKAAELGFAGAVQTYPQALHAFVGGDGQVVLNAHITGGSRQRVLEDAADKGGTAVFGTAGNVDAVLLDTAGGGGMQAGEGVEEAALSGAVGADDGKKVALGDGKIDVPEGFNPIGGTVAENQTEALQGDHGAGLRTEGLRKSPFEIINERIISNPVMSLRSLGFRLIR